MLKVGDICYIKEGYMEVVKVQSSTKDSISGIIFTTLWIGFVNLDSKMSYETHYLSVDAKYLLQIFNISKNINRIFNYPEGTFCLYIEEATNEKGVKYNIKKFEQVMSFGGRNKWYFWI